MKIALHAGQSAAEARFIRQLGLEDVVSGVSPSPSGIIELETLERQKEFFATHGLKWDVIENLPPPLYDHVMLGEEGREKQIDQVCQSIENIGRAGIGVLQYQWMILGGLRTEYSPTGRGGARYPRFDLAVASRAPAAAMDWLGDSRYPRIPERRISAEQVWENLVYFLERAVPVAEAAGVRLAVHPDDAPVPEYMGVARIFISVDSLQKAVDAVPSPNNGVGFCMGTIGTMADTDVVEGIRTLGGQDRIFFAHFRNPRGQVPCFDEVFPDEGDIDMVQAVHAFADVGFDGVIRIDHCPGVIGDNARADRSFAYQVGYLKGLVQSHDSLHRNLPDGMEI
jgi:mannonate dehydratase